MGDQAFPPAVNPKRILYVTDLDGTLIRNDLTMSAWARGELIALLNEGVPLTVATARSIASPSWYSGTT